MNKLWSEKNKEVQILISKETTFNDGIKALISLRNILNGEIFEFMKKYCWKNF